MESISLVLLLLYYFLLECKTYVCTYGNEILFNQSLNSLFVKKFVFIPTTFSTWRSYIYFKILRTVER